MTRVILGLMLIMALICGINGCGDMLSPTIDLKMAGDDMTVPQDDVHEGISGGESCGTANEKSGCHGKTITVE